MASVNDLWFRIDKASGEKVRTSRHGRGKRWRVTWHDDAGEPRSEAFHKKVDAERRRTKIESDQLRGEYVDPRTARMTVGEWCETWLHGYATRRPATVRQARVHLAQIRAEFGNVRLSAVRPSHVRSWTSRLRAEGLSQSYVYALHARLSQIMTDAVHDGVLTRNPCSRRTAPASGTQRPYVATTEQIWALRDTMPARYQAAVLLGAFAGLRVGEACGLRVEDVDFMRGVVYPTAQYPAEPLKTDTSKTPVPIPQTLSAELSAHVARWRAETVLTNRHGRQLEPWRLESAVRTARGKVDGLPAGFRFQDLRHYFASLLIASGADVKVVQARLRHASAKTTLDTYGHLWPDSDESTRAAVEKVLAARMYPTRTGKRGA